MWGFLKISFVQKKPKRLPVVLTHDEAKEVLSHIEGMNGVMANLLYGAGLRLMECIRLRVLEPDFDCMKIHIRQAKGSKD